MKRYLYVIFGLVLLGAGWFVRTQNGQEALRQAKSIEQRDADGAQTATPQDDLAAYVKQHTGATVGYTLAGSYNRELAAAKAQAAAASAANSQIYADAQKACGGKIDSITQAKCNQQYLSSHLQAVPATPVKSPDLRSYQHRLVAPIWTPDLAGALFLGGCAASGFGLITLMPRRRR